MPIVGRGLRDYLITDALEGELSQLGERLHAERALLRGADAADRIGLHLASVVVRAVDALPERERAGRGAALARRLVDVVVAELEVPELAEQRPVPRAEVLRAVMARLPDRSAEPIPQPLIHPVPRPRHQPRSRPLGEPVGHPRRERDRTEVPGARRARQPRHALRAAARRRARLLLLGPATYESHEGELPMAITWRLAHALPGDLYASFAAAVA